MSVQRPPVPDDWLPGRVVEMQALVQLDDGGGVEVISDVSPREFQVQLCAQLVERG